jgi:hypothetical protein
MAAYYSSFDTCLYQLDSDIARRRPIKKGV